MLVNAILVAMNTTEQKIRDLSQKWRYAQMEAADICRDAAEELRVMRLELEAAKRELQVYRELNRPKFIPNETVLQNGWGKGKDE